MELDPAIATGPTPPGVIRAFLLRFGAVYSALFLFPIFADVGQGLEWRGKLVASATHGIIEWVARSVLGISYELKWGGGSGDKTTDWVWALCCAAIALIASLVWLAIDRRRAHDEQIRAALRVVIRYGIAYILLDYGISKVFLGQFPPPNGSRLQQPYGESSPMGLMWTFMGASPAYVFFSGAAETVGALLLLFRRTTTLGALVLVAVLVNIVTMNFCYDVCVKLNSSHYLAMCVYLIVPDAAALWRLLVLRQPAQLRIEHPMIARRWLRVVRLVLKYGFSSLVLLGLVYEAAFESGRSAPDAWYEGIWDVREFQRNGQTVPPSTTEATRWQRIRFQVAGDKRYARWRFMDGGRADLNTIVVDDKQQTMTFQRERSDGDRKALEPTGPVVLHYVRGDAAHLTLEGKVGDDSLVMQVERFDPDKTLLMSRGFRWISEEPFNR